MQGAQRRTEYTQAFHSRKEYAKVTNTSREIELWQSRTSVHKLQRRTEYANGSKLEQSTQGLQSKTGEAMQGIQRRAEYVSIKEKNSVFMGCRVEQSMQF